jgi:hypothetical protein
MAFFSRASSILNLLLLLMLILILFPYSMQPVLSLEIALPESYKAVVAGQNLWYTLSAESQDEIILFEILDFEGTVIAAKNSTSGENPSYMSIPQTIVPGAYMLRAYSGSGQTDVPFTVIGQPGKFQQTIEDSLFDIAVEVPHGFSVAMPGSQLLATIKLINLGSGGRVDVFLDYWITDSAGNLVLKRKETVAVETQANFVRTFSLPEDMESGTYNIHAKMTYADGKEAEAQYSFEVKSPESHAGRAYIIAGALGVLFIVAVLFMLGPQYRKLMVKQKVKDLVRQREGKQNP